MKVFRLYIFSLMFFATNLAIADDFSEETNKNSHRDWSKSFLENERCKELQKNLKLVNKEISERKRKIDRLIKPDMDAIGVLVLGMVATVIVQPVGLALIGMAGLCGINNRLKKFRIAGHNDRILSMTEKRSFLMQECEKEECSEL